MTLHFAFEDFLVESGVGDIINDLFVEAFFLERFEDNKWQRAKNYFWGLGYYFDYIYCSLKY